MEAWSGGQAEVLPGAVLWRLWLDGVWADGTGGQEDELEDVAKGRLNPPTNTEGPGSVFERNDPGRGLESGDEDDALVEHIEDRGRGTRDEGGEPERAIEQGIEDLAPRAGMTLP